MKPLDAFSFRPHSQGRREDSCENCQQGYLGDVTKAFLIGGFLFTVAMGMRLFADGLVG